MATGLKVPVGVDKSGGARVETSVVEQKKKLLFQAFSPGQDKNAFQTLGLDPGLIFSIKDEFFETRARSEVRRIMGNFIDLMELSPDVPITFEDTAEGELEMSFQYVDLEVDEVQTFTKKFSKQG